MMCICPGPIRLSCYLFSYEACMGLTRGQTWPNMVEQGFFQKSSGRQAYRTASLWTQGRTSVECSNNTRSVLLSENMAKRAHEDPSGSCDAMAAPGMGKEVG